MDKQVVYTNHLGESIVFGRDSIYHYEGIDIHNREWSLTTQSRRILAATKDEQSFSFTVKIRGGGLEARNRLCDVLEADLWGNQDGMLTVGEWSLACRATSSTKSNWHFDRNVMTEELTFVSANPIWQKDDIHHFESFDEETEGISATYDYGYNHGYIPYHPGALINSGLAGDCNFLLRIFGPAINPFVIIDDNQYQVNVTLADGDRIEIDTRDKTIIKTTREGVVTNEYANRVFGAVNSGQYIFKPLSAGDNEITWSGGYSIDIVLHLERSEPEWVD